MKRKGILQFAMIMFVACVCLGGSTLGVILWHIDQSVHEQCSVAQQAFPHSGDDVTALIDLMNSSDHPLRERNHAAWTLGRLRDRGALPALESAYTGAPCQHEKFLCQYELEKAIKMCGGVPTPPLEAKH